MQLSFFTLANVAAMLLATPAGAQVISYSYCHAISPTHDNLFTNVFTTSKGVSETNNAWKAHVSTFRDYDGRDFSDSTIFNCVYLDTEEKASAHFRETYLHYRRIGQKAVLTQYGG